MESPNETINQPEHQFETTSVFGGIYNVEMLFEYSDSIHTKEMPFQDLREAVAEGHYYWDDKKGEKLGPADLLKDWEAAQQNDDWSDHVDNIKNADLQWPIWMTREGQVFNGMHRLTKYFVDDITPVKVKIFDSLPDEAIVN